VATAPAALAAGATMHATIDPTGQQISCEGTQLTITSGTLAMTWTTTQDSRGTYHVGGTNVPHSVVLTDDEGGAFELTGASRFTGTSTTPDTTGVITATDVDHFVIRNTTGAPIGSVRVVVRLSPTSGLVAIDSGTCDLVESE
jgi:hypothetical protein